MKLTIQLAPQNSVILIMDQSIGVVPDTFDGKLVAATETCIAVGTLSEFDGKTTINFSNEFCEANNSLSLIYEGFLATPDRKVSVCSVLNEALLTLNTESERCRVRIWASDPSEPDVLNIEIK